MARFKVCLVPITTDATGADAKGNSGVQQHIFFIDFIKTLLV